MSILNEREAIAAVLNPVTTEQMIAFLKTPWNESLEGKETAARYFKTLAMSEDVKASFYIQEFILGNR